MMFAPVIVIPVFNHDRYLLALVNRILENHDHCILVDDGSGEQCAATVDKIALSHAGRVSVVRHSINRGKGAAVITGAAFAESKGFTHLLQIDADWQHSVDDIPALLSISCASPDALVTGQPIFDNSVPKSRLYARYLTHFMVSINTLNFHLRDSMCGFRVYPIASLLDLGRRGIGERMEFDIEVFVKLDWKGVPILLYPTPVRYPIDGVSHFRMLRDNVRISWLHTCLFFGMLFRFPRILLNRRKVV